MSRRDIRLEQLLTQHIDGVPLDLAVSLLPWRSWLNLGLLMHLRLHARYQRRYQSAGAPRDAGGRGPRGGGGRGGPRGGSEARGGGGASGAGRALACLFELARVVPIDRESYAFVVCR